MGASAASIQKKQRTEFPERPAREGPPRLAASSATLTSKFDAGKCVGGYLSKARNRCKGTAKSPAASLVEQALFYYDGSRFFVESIRFLHDGDVGMTCMKGRDYVARKADFSRI